MSLEITSPISVEPVLLADVKAHLNLDHDLDDALLSIYISAARQYGEHLTRRAWGETGCRLRLDGFPRANDPIELPLPPLVSISAITYVDTGGETQTMAASDYVVDVPLLVGRIYPDYGTVWPSTRAQRNAVTVEYVAGSSELPEALQQWAMIRVAGMYEQREAFAIGTNGTMVNEMPRDFVDGLLDRYTVPGTV
jgi:uncharacterized phiE125 gp8 family phage protein